MMNKELLFVLLWIFTLPCIAQGATDPDLLLEYRFENNVDDDSGNDYHATNFGATFVEDRFGNPNGAIYFNGIDNYIEFPNLNELKPNFPLSFSFWIKFDDLATQNSDVFNTSFEEDKSSGVFFNLSSSTSQIGIGHGDGSNAYTPGTRRSFLSNGEAQVDVWTHITFVLNSSTDMKVYVNCQDLGGSYSGSGGDLYYSNTPGNIGRHDRSISDPAYYFKGSMDDFRYWKRALSEAEITSGTCGATLALPSESEILKAPVLYPNPTSGTLNIQMGNKEILEVNAYDLTGKKVFSSKYKPNLDISQLPEGIYMIQLIHPQGSTNKRIILKK